MNCFDWQGRDLAELHLFIDVVRSREGGDTRWESDDSAQSSRVPAEVDDSRSSLLRISKAKPELSGPVEFPLADGFFLGRRGLYSPTLPMPFKSKGAFKFYSVPAFGSYRDKIEHSKEK